MKTYFDPETGECLYCHGSGECPYCDGDGEIGEEECTACSGYGECPICKGNGERELPETFDVPFRQNVRLNPKHTEYLSDIFSTNYRNRNSRHRVALELLNSQEGNYRGHCVAAISDSEISPNKIRQLIRMLPGYVSYDDYIAVEGLVYSDHHYDLIRNEIGKLFYPWWRQLFLEIFGV
ncbi:MAG: hypothetical protein R3C14_18845 [Caldilineaceae bacterium]